MPCLGRCLLDAEVPLHLLQHILDIIIDLFGALLCSRARPLRAQLGFLRLPLRLCARRPRPLLSAGARLRAAAVRLLITILSSAQLMTIVGAAEMH